MAFSLNRAQIIGNLTRDPEVRQTPGGQTVATFGVATNFTWTDQSGVKQVKTEFHNVVAWRGLAEICRQYVKKGSKVYIEGRLQTRDWEGPDGVKRYRTEIIADNMIMLDGRRDIDSMGTAPRQTAPMAATGTDVVMETVSEAPSVDFEPVQSNSGTVSSNRSKEDDVSLDDLPF